MDEFGDQESAQDEQLLAIIGTLRLANGVVKAGGGGEVLDEMRAIMGSSHEDNGTDEVAGQHVTTVVGPAGLTKITKVRYVSFRRCTC